MQLLLVAPSRPSARARAVATTARTKPPAPFAMKVDFHAANCGPVCKCGEGVLGRQSLEELEFTRSACAAAMNGQLDKLEQLLSLSLIHI